MYACVYESVCFSYIYCMCIYIHIRVCIIEGTYLTSHTFAHYLAVPAVLKRIDYKTISSYHSQTFKMLLRYGILLKARRSLVFLELPLKNVHNYEVSTFLDLNLVRLLKVY